MMGAKNHAVVLPDANREQTSTRWSARLRRGRPALHGHLGGGAGGQGPRMAAGHQGRGQKLKVNAGSEPGTDVGPVVSKRPRRACWA
jgi:malonate-semialdehyde dehydrogenase (acetylating)/methylmalonate-semialdehyde dehydrogenase